jgi:hypothetical protein
VRHEKAFKSALLRGCQFSTRTIVERITDPRLSKYAAGMCRARALIWDS